MEEKEEKKKISPLKVIQIAWVVEAAVVCLQTIIAWWVCYALKGQEYFTSWIGSVPILAALIAGQGAAASVGPLVSDKIKATVSRAIDKEI